MGIWQTAITVLGTILVALIAARIKLIEIGIGKGRNKKKLPKLVYAEIFGNIDGHIHRSKSCFQGEDAGKVLLAKELFDFKCRAWKRVLFELAGKIDACENLFNNDTCPTHVYNMNIEYLNKGLSETDKVVDIQIDADKEAMLIFLNKFNSIHEQKVKFMQDVIKAMSYAQYLDGCVERQNVIFKAYDLALEMTLVDIEDTLAQINGDLNGLMFKGELISH